jgi:uncharacterized protein involved in exopolysaccharide biosynthesis
MNETNERLEKIERQLQIIASDKQASSGFGLTDRGDEIDLGELVAVIWKSKWWVTGIAFSFLVASVIYALSLPNIYRSEALLAPAEENSGGGLAGMAGNLGGLASLAGVNLSGGEADKTTIALEILKSREFVGQIVRDYDFLVPLMAAKGWDSKQNQLIIDNDIYDEVNRKWVRESNPPRTAEPSRQEAYKEFMSRFSVSKDKDTGLVSLSVEHYSPVIAKEWVDLLVREINTETKQRDMEDARKSIQYLSNQLEKTAISDMKAVFYELIEEQTKTLMFAEVRDEYVFKTIDKAIVPELKAKPKKALICLLGLVLGGIIGVLFVLVRYFTSEVGREKKLS